jgi:hypothetical protein
MRVSEVSVGMLVRRISDTFVTDAQQFSRETRRVGIVTNDPFMGNPVPGKRRSTLRKVTVQWVGTSIGEDIYVHRLEPATHETIPPKTDQTSEVL